MTQPESSSHQPEAERAPQDVVRHVIACSPCGESVDGLTAQDDVLRHLARPQKHPALVEHMLGQTARVGKHELGALLYEMGRASLMLVPEASLHLEFPKQPAPLASLSQQAKRMSCRVSDANVQQVLDAAPTAVPNADDAASLALAFADAFLTFDWRRQKGLLLRAGALMELGDFDATQLILRDLIATASDPQVALIARQNITRALLRAGEHAAALDRAREFVRDYAGNPILWLNYVIAAGWQADQRQFEIACSGFRSSTTAAAAGSDFWQTLLTTEIPWLASRFDLDSRQVADSLAIKLVGSL